MKAEQQALLTKAGESLEAAAVLYEHEFYDFAVSRAYYTMFYVAEALLLGEELSFAKHFKPDGARPGTESPRTDTTPRA